MKELPEKQEVADMEAQEEKASKGGSGQLYQTTE